MGQIETPVAKKEVKPANPETIKKLLKVAVIIFAITVGEFVLAYTLDRGLFLYSLFIGLTMLKAAYIVLEFMHLKYENKTLIWSILLPCLFLIWFIIALLNEGGAVFEARFF
ncbi:cytochrome C oxidase subunit IV family protein [Aureibacter tunicatorum]|uniref:Cytochrome c oxidase subunit IV n=1 Tax=Aureibacter tunicatorum TaxID=866807 RepID=A0AAE4BQD7_9BACT|nr:cytochrome C oxidase subunit IV family protein [Aureibacter tunicatorum]MDR6238989.1 cytochrome c oxidase subunit IV [Aureibacter tunicatorum]BDD05085.1 hypothetical protein AUTU_25680 [Aureibacter tunicatorum]